MAAATAAAVARTLAGRVAVVTGSTSGIGLGIARVLASRGADVVLHGKATDAELAALRESFAREFKVRVATSSADLLGGEKAAKELVDAAEKGLGKKPTILVNNAGIQHVSSIEDFDAAAFERVIAINLTACFYTTKACLPGMRAEGYGRIINIASAHGLVASAMKSAYVASKHGVLGLTKVTALETAGSGVTANAICPGWVLTPLVEAQIRRRAEEGKISYEKAKVDLLSEKQPSKEFATAEQIGAAAAFLCDAAASQITGTHLSVDGGWTAQ